VLSTSQAGENEVEVSITDNGQGIPKESLEKIFGKFYQHKRESGSGYKGTGIGLAVCKGLVEIMGGRIWVESEPGKGTSFKFTVPTKRPLQDQQP
jgi:signal transduction histidine kinase